MAFEEMMAWPTLGGPQRLAIARFTTTTVYPDPHVESTTVDGYASDTTQAAWGTIRGAAGDQADDSNALLKVNIKTAFNSSPDYETMRRGVVLFDTSGIDDSDTKDSATCELVVNSKSATLSADSVSMCTSAPASNTAIVAGDYDSHGTTKQSNDLTISGITADNTTYNAWTLDSTGLGNIDLAGVSKFGFRMLSDLSDAEPTYGNDDINEIQPRTADQAGTSKDPKLVIVHTSPFTPKVIMF